MNDEQLTQRMRAASGAIEMSDTAQARHLEAISAALSDGDVIHMSSTRPARRRRVIASVVAAAVIAPTGLAAASENSVPGDALYPVKQLSERVRVLFDADVIARHRVEEIEALESTGQAEAELYERARAALAELGEDHPLWDRLATPASNAEDAPVSVDDDASASVSGPQTLELELPDGSQARITINGGQLVDIDPPAGWTVTEIDDEEAKMESGRYEVDLEVLSDGTLRTHVADQTDESPEDDSTSDGVRADEDSEDDVNEGTETRPSVPAEDESDDDDSSDSDDDRDPADDDTSEDG